MTVGQRIKDRLEELNHDVKWLHQKTGIPVSSLYEIMNGRMKSTPRLPTIAAALGLRALWLEKKTGPRLISDADQVVQSSNDWPFSKERFERLNTKQKAHLLEVVEGILTAYEAHPHTALKSGSQKRKAG